MIENELLYQVGELKPEDFSTEYHREMYRALWAVISQGGTADAVTLSQYLVQQGKPKVGDYIVVFDDGINPVRNIEPHVKEIARTSRRRSIIRALEGAVAQAYDMSESNEDVISVTHDKLLNLASASMVNQSFHVKDFSFQVYEGLRRLAERDTSASLGLTTAVTEVDDLTTGFRPGELAVIGAYTGEGKTAYLEQILAANCYRGVPALMFSQEMSKEQVLIRMIPYLTGGRVTARKLRDPRLMNMAQKVDVENTQSVIDGWPLWVNDASRFDVNEMVAHSHAMIRRYGIRLIGVDYLQLLKASGKDKREQVGNASEALRSLAKSQKVAVVALSQLGRPGDKVKRPPTMFDLKESGEIEEDAHLVLLLYRPVEKDKGTFTRKDFIIVGKQREGPTGSVKVRFNSDMLIFEARSEQDEPPEGYDQDQLDRSW